MSLAVFYKAETTGLPLYNDPSDDPRQPHIVELAAALVDLGARRVVSSMDLIVRPKGWTIPEEATAIHGITTERALAVGVPEDIAVGTFMELWDGRERISHSEAFSARIVRIATLRYDDIDADTWKDGKAQCTQKLATPLLKGKVAGRSPKLSEAHLHLVGHPMHGPDSAMADVQACIAVFFALQDRASA
jgi:DNA polymerase-3 subunit epsilon